MTRSIYSCERALIEKRVHDDVSITVDDGRFTAIEIGVEVASGATRLRGLTLPGLANSHSHAFHRALRSRTQTGGGSFWTWRDIMYQAADRLDPDGYHRLARATFSEMVLAGITVVGEFHYLHHQRDGTPYADPNAMGEALLAAASEAGIRITLLDTLYLHGGLGVDGYAELEGPQRRYGDGSVAKWVERVELMTASPAQRIGAAIHSVRAVDEASMKVVAEWAGQHAAPLHAHVSEQRAENEQCRAAHGTTPTGLLHEAGVLSDRFSAVHATHVDKEDIQKMSATGSAACLCPTTERDLGDGIGPTSQLAAAGVSMTLGSDSHAVIDLFEEARAVELNERLRAEQRGIHSTTDLLAMSSINGHASLGWADAGAIVAGNRADLVTVALDSVRTAGTTTRSAAEAAVFAASANDVTDVIVDGTRVVTDTHHQRIDVAAELHTSITELMQP